MPGAFFISSKFFTMAQKITLVSKVVFGSDTTPTLAQTAFNSAMVTELAAAQLAAAYPVGSDASSTQAGAYNGSVTVGAVNFIFDGSNYIFSAGINYSVPVAQ